MVQESGQAHGQDRLTFGMVQESGQAHGQDRLMFGMVQESGQAQIVSHSSVFLFTRLEALSGPHGEIDESLVFQSFIGNKLLMVSNLVKVLLALSPGGKFFINVQTNPLPLAEVGPPEDRFKFEMTRCVYNLDTERVEKMFRATYQAKSYVMSEIHYCSRYSDFKRYVELIGGTVELVEDAQWVILERVQ